MGAFPFASRRSFFYVTVHCMRECVCAVQRGVRCMHVGARHADRYISIHNFRDRGEWCGYTIFLPPQRGPKRAPPSRTGLPPRPERYAESAGALII